MKDLNRLIRMSIGLGLLSLAALGVSVLALTDIAHGESDLSLEWRFLNVAGVVILMYVALGVVTLLRVLKADTAAKRPEK